MNYKEKRILVTLLSGVLILVAYCLYSFDRVRAGVVALDDLKFWATTMLIFIGIGIVSLILILIVFHILLSIAMSVKAQVQNGKCDDKKIEQTLELDMVEDEMDKLIELKSMRIGFAIAGAGFILALVSLALSWPPAVMLNILFASFSIGSMMEGIIQLHYYRKGLN